MASIADLKGITGNQSDLPDLRFWTRVEGNRGQRYFWQADNQGITPKNRRSKLDPKFALEKMPKFQKTALLHPEASEIYRLLCFFKR